MVGTIPQEPDSQPGLREVVDNSPMSRTQIAAVAVTAMLSALDGYDVLSATFAAPSIGQEWGLGKTEIGVLLSSGMVGMGMGSLLLAQFADVIGRRKMVGANLMLMAFGMLMSAYSASLTELVFWRFMTGLGIGSMVPVIAPLAAEFSNARRRMLSVAIMSIGYPLGGMVGGIVAAALLQWFDWRAVFLLGAGLALVLMGVSAVWLPEPLSFLVETQKRRSLGQINALLRRIGQHPIDTLPAPSVKLASVPYRQIFARGQRAATLRVTIINFLYVISANYILSWMPQIVVDAGFSVAQGAMVSALANLSGAVVCILLGLLAPHIAPVVRTAAPIFGLGLGVALFGLVPASFPLLVVAGIFIGACLFSGVAGIYSLAVNTFDVSIRATGLGVVLGVGRASSAAAPLLAGVLFALGAGPGIVSMGLGSCALIAGIIVLRMARGERNIDQARLG